MLYNKLQNAKVNDKKVLHKIGKHWVVVSSALLMALGGGALATQASAHADTVNDNPDNKSNNNKMNVPVKSAGSHLIQQNNDQNLHSQSDSLGHGSNVVSPVQSFAASQSFTSGKFANQSNSNANSETGTYRIEQHADQMHQRILQRSVAHQMGTTSLKNNGNSKALHSNQSKSVSNRYGVSNSNSITRIHHHLLGDSDSDDSDNIGTIVVRYENDQKGNEIENQTSSSDVNGTPFTDADKNSLKGAPKGYLYDGFTPSDSNITHYIGGKAQFLNIRIKPAPAVPKFNRIVIRYEITNQGNKMTPGEGAQHVQYDAAGQPFPLKQFLANVPDGYYLDPNKPIIAGKDVTTYKPGTQMVQIGVLPDSDKPNPNNSSQKRMVSMPINYKNGSSIVKTMTTPNRVEGSSFDIVPYEQAPNMPSGYSFENSNAPLAYTYGKTVTINVTPINSDHNGGPNTSQTDQMNINYLNFSDFAPEGHLISKGMDGQLFNADQYKTMVPSGFTFYSFDGTVPKAYTPNGSLNIFVVPSVIKMPVNYQLSNGTVIKSVTATGSINQPFNVKPYQSNVPAGYEVVSVNGPSEYQINQSVNITVQPVPKVTMDVRYLDRTNGNRIISTVPATGSRGDSFNAAPYESNVPHGYRFYSTGQVPSTYQPGASFDIDVIPVGSDHNHQAATGSINVSYVDANGNLIGDSYNISNTVGTPFNIQDYETSDKIKSGYHFVSTQSNVNKFEPGNQNVRILVAPNVNPNDQSKLVSMSVYYVDSDNNIINQRDVFGNAGSALPLTQYEQDVPQGYHVKNVVTSNSVNTFTPNGLIIVNMIRNQVQPMSGSNANFNPSSQSATSSVSSSVSSTATAPQSQSTASNTSQSTSSSSLTSGSNSQTANSQQVINNRDAYKHKRHHLNHKSNNAVRGNTSDNDMNTKTSMNRDYHGTNANSAVASPGNGISDDGAYENDLGSRYNGVSNAENGNSQSSSKLPQTGEKTDQSEDIAAILLAISVALSSLGYAIRRRHDD